MSQTNINIRIDSEVKQNAQELFAEIGMDMSTAINLFLRQAIRTQSIPFDLSLNVPNAETISAIKESILISHDKTTKHYESFQELLEEIDNDDEI